jgi:hypothetical protein
MRVIEMPTSDFLAAALDAAESCDYPALAVLIARTADAGKLQKHILDDWSSLDDVTADQILVVTPASSAERYSQAVVFNPDHKEHGEAATSEALLVQGQSPRWDRSFWELATRHQTTAPGARRDWKTALTRSATETLRFFDLSEDMAPCLVLLSLGERRLLIFRGLGKTDLYTLLRKIITEWEPAARALREAHAHADGGQKSRPGGEAVSFADATLAAARKHGFRETESRPRDLRGHSWRMTILEEAPPAPLGLGSHVG